MSLFICIIIGVGSPLMYISKGGKGFLIYITVRGEKSSFIYYSKGNMICFIVRRKSGLFIYIYQKVERKSFLCIVYMWRKRPLLIFYNNWRRRPL
jgi:hypothetical protein